MAAGDNVTMGQGVSNDTLTANNSTITLKSEVHVDVDGDGNAIDATSDTVNLGTGDSGDTVTGNDNAVDAANGDFFAVDGAGSTINGSADSITLVLARASTSMAQVTAFTALPTPSRSGRAKATPLSAQTTASMDRPIMWCSTPATVAIRSRKTAER